MPFALRASLPLALALTACGRPSDAPQVALRPDAPTTLDQLVAEVVPAAEHESPRISFTWLRDGQRVDGEVGDTIAPELTAKGQRWQVQVTTRSGLADGPAATAEVDILNTPPDVTLVLEPARPTTGSEALRAVTESVDADGDEVRLRYTWTLDDAPTEHDGAAVHADLLRRGQIWGVTVTPNDGEVDGEPASAVALIENARPIIDAVTLEPEQATVTTTLRAVATEPRDADGDPVAIRYIFRVDGTVVQDSDADTLAPGGHRKGQQVTAAATPNDGFNDGEPVESAPLTIENTPPSAPEIEFDESPAPGRDLVCTIMAAAVDADGDSLRHDFAWTLDGAAYGGAIDEEMSSLVPGAEVELDQTWACEVTAFDGEAFGPTARVESEALPWSLQRIPAGSFSMGCVTERDDVAGGCLYHERPAHTVTISRSFDLMTTEVTQGQWLDITGENPSWASDCGSDCPVENITWWSAVWYANEVSSVYGLPACYELSGCTGSGALGSLSCTGVTVKAESVTACRGYRLPTESEWEYAARGGESHAWAGGSEVGTVSWYSSNSRSRMQPVCGKATNGYGLCDMSGNVFEMTWDLFGSYTSAAKTDPDGADSGTSRIIRGGSFDNAPQYVRVANRYWHNPRSSNDKTGFRLLRPLP